MIKQLLLITTILGLTGCKHQNDENQSLKTKSDNRTNSEYLLEKNKNDMHFTKKSEKPKELLFKCKENDNGISRYDDPLNKTCICNDSTFNSAYKIFYNESPDFIQNNLLKKLPQKNSVWKAPDAEVTYSWILQDTLKINMFFQGGENNYVFYKNSDNKMEYKEFLSLP